MTGQEQDAMAPLRMLTRRDLRERKGIPWSRQRLHEKIKLGEFPPLTARPLTIPTRRIGGSKRPWTAGSKSARAKWTTRARPLHGARG